MLNCWKITLPCTRAEAEELAEDNLFLSSSDSIPTIVTREANPQTPDDWLIEVYSDEKPNRKFLNTITKLSPSAALAKTKPKVEKIEDLDWVTLSQQGLEPLRTGRFFVHTSHDTPNSNPRIRNLSIDASQAFGTGHHETTLGCLLMLDKLKTNGQQFRNIVDVGTGTGLLAFAASHLWPSARVIAGDIDPVAVEVSKQNATTNRFSLGSGPGKIAICISNGLDHSKMRQRAPYNLIIANILAGPLISLAPQIAGAAKPGTRLILAGLLQHQKDAVVSAYLRGGFRLRSVRVENEWPCLLFVKGREYGRKRTRRQRKSPLAEDYFGEC